MSSNLINNAIINKIIKCSYNINNNDFNDAMEEYITNISNIQLDSIPEFIPCNKKLYITRPKMRELIRGWLKIKLPQFFRQRTYENYDEINNCNIKKFEDIIEIAIQIMTNKQRGIN